MSLMLTVALVGVQSAGGWARLVVPSELMRQSKLAAIRAAASTRARRNAS